MKEKYLSDEFINSVWIFYETNLSVRTRREYFAVICNYSKVTENDPLHITQASVDCYYHYLEKRLKENRLSYSTAVMRLSVMRTLCEYIRFKKEKAGLSYINYFSEIVLPENDKTLTEEMLPSGQELNTLLSIAQASQDDMAFLIFSLVMKCGLTSSEISTLNIEYLMLDKNNCFCINFPSKTKFSRIIKLPEDISNLLSDYIEQTQLYEGPIFLNKRKNRLKIRDAERLLNKYLEVGIREKQISRHFTMQTMRHAAFRYMLSGGATQEEVAIYGGITTKWMSRYKQVIDTDSTLNSADLSIISIKH